MTAKKSTTKKTVTPTKITELAEPPTQRKTRNEYDVSPEVFVTAWQMSASIDEVCEKLKMPKSSVNARATSYRKLGVTLKAMPRRGRQSINVDALNAKLEEINQEHGITVTPRKQPLTEKQLLSQIEESGLDPAEVIKKLLKKK